MARNRSEQTSLVRRPDVAPAERWAGPGWGLLESFRRDFDRLFDSFFAWPGSRSVAVEPAGLGGLDVFETADEIRVKVDLPGLSREDVQVTVTTDNLTIKGERKHEEESEEGQYHWRGASYGAFERTIRLPAEVSADKVKATMKDGVLHVRMPKVQAAVARTISVEAE